MIEINALGTMNGTVAALARMTEGGSGHVINVVSLAGLIAAPGEVNYSASKHAAMAYTLGTLFDLRRAGYDVRVLPEEDLGLSLPHLGRERQEVGTAAGPGQESFQLLGRMESQVSLDIDRSLETEKTRQIGQRQARRAGEDCTGRRISQGTDRGGGTDKRVGGGAGFGRPGLHEFVIAADCQEKIVGREGERAGHRLGFLNFLLAGLGGGFGLSVLLRDGDEVFRTYFTTARGVDRLRLDFNLLDLTPYGRQEQWEDSPEGWPRRLSADGGQMTLDGRPAAQWPRLAAGRSDDLT